MKDMQLHGDEDHFIRQVTVEPTLRVRIPVAPGSNGSHNGYMNNAVFGMLRRVALVRADVSEECVASIIRVTGIADLGTLANYCHPEGGDAFLLNVGSYKSHRA
jgi:hypothetical protein